MSILKKIDDTFKGIKTYASSGIGFFVVSYLQSQGIDAIAFLDLVWALINDTIVQVTAIWAIAQSVLRKAMPDKRSEQ